MKSKNSKKKELYFAPNVGKKKRKEKVKAENSFQSEEDEDLYSEPLNSINRLISANSTNSKSLTLVQQQQHDLSGKGKDFNVLMCNTERNHFEKGQQTSFMRSGDSFLTEREASIRTGTMKNLKTLTSYGSNDSSKTKLRSLKGSKKNIKIDSFTKNDASKDEQSFEQMKSMNSILGSEYSEAVLKKTIFEGSKNYHFPSIKQESFNRRRGDNTLNHTSNFSKGDLNLYSPRGNRSEHESVPHELMKKQESYPSSKQIFQEEWDFGRENDEFEVYQHPQEQRQRSHIFCERKRSIIQTKKNLLSKENSEEKTESAKNKSLEQKRDSVFFVNAPFKVGTYSHKMQKKDEKRYSTAGIIVSFFRKRISIFDDLKSVSKKESTFQEEKKQEYVENYIKTMEKVVEDLFIACEKRRNKTEILNLLSKIVHQIQNLAHQRLVIVILMALAKIMNLLKDYSQVLTAYKQASVICDIYELIREKMKVYRGLGQVNHNLQNFAKAKTFYVKMLQAAWYLNDHKYELLAYDYLGVIAYYEGNIELARNYHEKLIKCDLETPQSGARELGIKRFLASLDIKRNLRSQVMNLNKINSSSEGEDDIQLEFKTERQTEKEFSNGNNRFQEKDKKLIKTQDQIKVMIEKGGGTRNFKAPTQIKLNRTLRINKISDNIIKTLSPNIDIKFRVNPLSGDSEVLSDELSRDKNSPDYTRDEKRFRVPGSKELNITYRVMKYSQLNKSGSYFCHLSNLRTLNRFHNILSNSYKEKQDEGFVDGLVDVTTSSRIKVLLEKLYINFSLALSRIKAYSKEKALNLGQGRRVALQANLNEK